MYTYHNLIKRRKAKHSIFAAWEDIFAYVYPIVISIFFADVKFGTSEFRSLIYFSIPYLIYLLCRVVNVYKISNDKRDAYRQQIMEQVDNVVLEKYNLLCSSVHRSPHINDDVLVYSAHSIIRKTLKNIKQLTANITGVSLDNISVDFIYKYQGTQEHWQSIDGSVSCSIGQLDDIVENKESMYHYLYANNHEYTFFNNKADADWHMYRPSLRDSEDRNKWGSIYCKRILCTMHQDRFVDGILSISTYNEKFIPTKRKAAVKEIEGLINYAVSAFTNIIKAEMASLYIRHEAIKKSEIDAIQTIQQIDCIDIPDEVSAFFNNDPIMMSEKERREILKTCLPEFKKKVNKNHPDFFELDAKLDQKTIIALQHYSSSDTSK